MLFVLTIQCALNVYFLIVLGNSCKGYDNSCNFESRLFMQLGSLTRLSYSFNNSLALYGGGVKSMTSSINTLCC